MKRRVRGLLLVLLWIWAGCVFLVLDLFTTIPQFDRIRPDARLYRGMRHAAHAMVGEPLAPASGVAAAARGTPARRAGKSGPVLAPDDPRRIVAALEREGDARELLRTAQDASQPLRVRRAAARLLGRCGTEADLERLLRVGLPAAVRDGAVLGLGELGSAWAVERLLALAHRGRASAPAAIARLDTPQAGARLRPVVVDRATRPDVREAACRALGRIGDPGSARALGDALADRESPPSVRAAAANALGRLAAPEVLGTVARARSDPDPVVARQARLAHTRLAHRS